MPRLAEISLNRQSLLFTLGLTMLVGLLFGLAPLLDLKRLDLNASLKEGGRSGAGPSQRRASRWFVIAGRTFTPQEVWRSSNLVVINQSLAERYWGAADKAIGRRLAENGRDASPKWLTVVGVVADSKQTSLLSEAEPEVFQPYADHALPPMSLLIRAKTDPLSLAAAVRREVQQLDAQLPVFNVAPLTRLLEDALAHRRAAMWLLALFAALALLLATVGVYGVMSYAVSRRAPEMGLRLALGAQRADLMRLVLVEGLKLIATGVVIGLIAALALTRLMTGLLYGVSEADPLTFAGVALLLITVALAACFIPARRAAKTDPMIALRTE